jgi:hypothetical protein
MNSAGEVDSSADTHLKMVLNGFGKLGIATAGPTSYLHVNGSVAWIPTTVTTSTTLTDAHATVRVNNSGSVNITLPAASGCVGRIYVIKKISAAANDVVIVGTIDGVSNKTLTLQNSSVILQSNGTTYDIIGGHASSTIY